MPEFLVEPVWSWPLVLLISIALVAVVLLTYPPRVAQLPPTSRRLLIGLRLATALVLIFAMLRPALRYSQIDKQAAQLVVLMDSSRSMTTTDGSAGLSRRAALLKDLVDARPQLAALAKEVELRYLDFAEDIAPVDAPDPAAEGRATAIGKALDELRRDDAGKRLVGIVLMSDGGQRTVGENSIDPRIAARRFAEQRGVPIHTVTYGSSDLSGTGLDLAIEDVVLDAFAYEKKTVPVRFQLRTTGAAGRRIKLRLLIERASAGTEPQLTEIPLTSDSKPFEELEITSNKTEQTRELSFTAGAPGEYKLAVEAVPIDSELKTNNNRYETVLTVQKGGLKVAYFDVARSVEQKFIRRLNENARIQLDVFLVPGGKFYSQARLDPTLFEKERYDVYLIGDVPASVFQQGGRDLLKELVARCSEGAGLAMLGGTYNFGMGGYANSAIGPLLPVQMSPAERVAPPEQPPASLFLPGPVQMLPGPDGRAHYAMQLGPNNEAIWKSLPPLQNGANKLIAKSPAVNLLAVTEKRDPLLLGWDIGTNRVLALGANDTWRWWTHGHEREHQRFWEQILLWLAHMENESDQPVWVRINPRNFEPGNRVPMVFGAQDEHKHPIADAVFSIEVTGPDGKKSTVPPQRSGEEQIAEFASTAEPGDYSVIVSAMKDGQPVGAPARTRFIVDRRDLELDNPSADPDLMAEIATISGAVPVPSEKLQTFLSDLLREGLSSEVTRYTQVNLWDGWPLLLVFVLLLVTEWVVRKRRGLV